MTDQSADSGPAIDVQFAGTGAVPGADDVVRWARAVLGAEQRADALLCIRISDEDEARSANARYRGIDRPTNVLSFPAELDAHPHGHQVLGDLLICAPLVRREAADQGKQEAHHWAHLVVHGVLHLLGYDHQSEEEARAMEGREIDVLKGLGIPDPYQLRHNADP